MPIWIPAPVDMRPSLTLSEWRIIELKDGARHFVGYHAETGSGRVSSAIKAFDPAARRGITDSGRVYQLAGEPGYHADAEYVLSNWMLLYGEPSCIDVTEAVVSGAERREGDGPRER